MATPHRPSPLSFDAGRQSPFKRQNSASPATVRATTPTQTSPLKPINSGGISTFSPSKTASLSPEKTSPFVRRPSQISQTSERPSSPFARPTSGLNVPASPSRQSSYASRNGETSTGSARTTPAPEEEEDYFRNMAARPLPSPSPSPFDGPAPDSPSVPIPSQSMLRPTTQRSTTASSTTSTVKPPIFNPAVKTATPKPVLGGGGSGYKNVPQPLLRSMRESFEVLDSNNTGGVNSTFVASMLEQMGMEHNPAALRDFFPPNAPAQLNLARYLDTLSAPLAELSPPDELMAAFSAFDVDDSGQIDVAELRKALMMTAPEPGDEDYRMSEREIDSILGEFSGRRAFGAKGINVAKGKGEVFRYREFMGAITGGPGAEGGGGEGIVA